MLGISQKFSKQLICADNYVVTRSVSYIVKPMRQVMPSPFDPNDPVTKVVVSIEHGDVVSKISKSFHLMDFEFHKKFIFPWIVNIQRANEGALIKAEIVDDYCQMFYQVVAEVGTDAIGKIASENPNDEFLF